MGIQLIIVYLSDNCDYKKVVPVIDGFISSSKCYIIGDFNFIPEDKNDLSEYFIQIGLVQVIKSPTHEKGRTIDHFYVPKKFVDKVIVKLTYPIYSDHAAICVKFH